METARKVLIADDSITIQRVFERTLPSEEFHLFFATDGQEAIEKAREILPHLIIADINMPSKGGMEICEELKRDPQLKDIPILLLVGVLDDFDEEEGKRAGAAGYLVKPFEAEAALSRIREVLAQAPPVEEPPKEEIIELTEVVEEPTFEVEEEVKGEEVFEEAVGPQEVEPGEEAFVLETPLKELEKELQEVLKEGKEEEMEEGELEEMKLDLSLEEISFEGELREEPQIPPQETEKLEEMLKESVAELEKIEGAPEEAPVEEEFVRAFEEEFAPVEPERPEQREAAGELEEALRRLVRAMAEEVVKALSDEIKKVVKEALEEEVSHK